MIAATVSTLPPAHPRRCGENMFWISSRSDSAGSSPQVRGKLPNVAGSLPSSRLIPAGAGKTARYYHARTTTAAHPRRCGENSVRYSDLSFKTGSSPQVRGKQGRSIQNLLASRLIPAGAGKTSSDIPVCFITSAHPRRCGENLFTAQKRLLISGSSPQVRGKREAVLLLSNLGRLIPAGAGKTQLQQSLFLLDTAHPRRCGENVDSR